MNQIDAKLSRFGHNKMSNFSVAEVTEHILNSSTELVRNVIQDDETTSEINRYVKLIKISVI